MRLEVGTWPRRILALTCRDRCQFLVSVDFAVGVGEDLLPLLHQLVRLLTQWVGGALVEMLAAVPVDIGRLECAWTGWFEGAGGGYLLNIM